MKLTLLVLTLCMSVTGAASAQQQQAVIVAAPPADEEAVSVMFDERESRSQVGVNLSLSNGNPAGLNALEWYTHFSHAGRRLLAKPEVVSVNVFVPCEHGDALRQSDPVICADGRCQSYNLRAPGGCVGGLMRMRTSGGIELRAAEFEGMAKAKEVRLTIGGIDFVLTEKHLKSLAKLAERMNP